METKTAAIAGCEFLCVPSLQESFGIVYIEAWSLDKAVIGGKNPAVACVIEHAKDGFLLVRIRMNSLNCLVIFFRTPRSAPPWAIQVGKRYRKSIPGNK